jgi:hypothetical protein
MNTRDRYALAVGILLGIVSGALTVAAAFAAGLVFIACSILSPLIVSLVAQNRIMTLSQVPNLVMTLTALIIFVVFIGYSSMPWRYGPGEILVGIVAILMMAAIPALALSGLVKLIRRRK